ncbi:hypothetical protein [Streptomyces anulatus]
MIGYTALDVPPLTVHEVVSRDLIRWVLSRIDPTTRHTQRG